MSEFLGLAHLAHLFSGTEKLGYQLDSVVRGHRFNRAEGPPADRAANFKIVW